VPTGLAAGVAVLGLIALVFGMIQPGLLPGSAHWIIQVLHLLIGMAAVASGEVIGGRVRRLRLAEAHP
jgi:ABC-type multidrug transport system permease subunit